VVELAQPTIVEYAGGSGPRAHGEGFFALTFKTRNLGKAAEFLKSKQLHAHPDGRRFDHAGAGPGIRHDDRIH